MIDLPVSAAMATVGLIVASSLGLLLYAQHHHRRRLAQLSEAEALWEKHARAVDTFLHADAASDELKLFLVHLTEVLADRAAAPTLVQKFAETAAQSQAEQASPQVERMRVALAVMHQKRPELFQAFGTAVGCGLLAALWSDPASADRLQRSLTALAARGTMADDAVRLAPALSGSRLLPRPA